ncbi:MAG: glycosyltransferase family 39 protein [Candidatus Omnitrophica bacterium]|nr:glycosyltransferase family 39 protein [Candidatus Omnitrophota bacterium]
MKKAYLSIIIISSLILISGLTSELYLGDESYHWRFAKDWFTQGKRPIFDSLYESSLPPGFPYGSEPLWPFGLAFLWKIFNKISFPLAQIYHTFYFLLLLLFTYLVAKELYNEEVSFYSFLILATIPMILAFSILFYLEVPVTSFIMFTFLMLLKKRYLLAGIGLGLIYLTKRNGLFLTPFFILFILYYEKTTFKRRILNISIFILTSLLLIVPDIYWREKNFKIEYNLREIPLDSEERRVSTATVSTLLGIINRLKFPPQFSFKRIRLFSPPDQATILNIIQVLRYFGLVAILLIILNLINRKQREDLILWLAILCYFIFFLYFFTPAGDLRYLMPVVPFISILIAKTLFSIKKRYLRYTIFTLCFIQFISTLIYVNMKRHIPKDLKEGFNYLKYNTANDSLILYPGHIILEISERKVLWSRKGCLILNELFWSEEKDKIINSIFGLGIDYIMIDKDRIYDDSISHHYGGYPKSFVERLPNFDFIDLVFKNNKIKIFKINKEKLLSYGN